MNIYKIRDFAQGLAVLCLYLAATCALAFLLYASYRVPWPYKMAAIAATFAGLGAWTFFTLANYESVRKALWLRRNSKWPKLS